MNSLKEAKQELYRLLLEKREDELTNNEVDMIYHLALDKDVQSVLDEKLT